MPIPWTKEMITDLLELTTDRRLNYDMIASIMSFMYRVPFSKNACIGKARRAGALKRQNGPARRIRRVQRPRPLPRPPAEPLPDLPLPYVPSPPIAPERKRFISIYALGAHTCRWPYGKDPPFLYCGARPIADRPYCLMHARMSYIPVRK